jgi:23S rRNA (cytidine2498-2'-O)-methyltransferase
VAVNQGASVVAVDRSPLREDLMRHAQVTFVKGDAFTYEPVQPVDWMVCDVIAAPERNIDLVLRWARAGWMRRFVVSIKFKGQDDYGKVDALAEHLAPLCSEYRLTRLNANKNEACVMGVLGDVSAA